MKKSLTQVLVFAALAGFTGLAVAQQIFTPKSQPTSAQTKPPIPQEATTVKSSKSNSADVRLRSIGHCSYGQICAITGET